MRLNNSIFKIFLLILKFFLINYFHISRLKYVNYILSGAIVALSLIAVTKVGKKKMCKDDEKILSPLALIAVGQESKT